MATMNTLWTLLFGLSLVFGYLLYFKNNLVRSLMLRWYEQKIAPKQNMIINSLFQAFLNVTAGDMGNLIYKGISLVLGVAALFFLTKLLGMSMSS